MHLGDQGWDQGHSIARFQESLQVHSIESFQETLWGHSIARFQESLQGHSIKSFQEALQGHSIANFQETLRVDLENLESFRAVRRDLDLTYVHYDESRSAIIWLLCINLSWSRWCFTRLLQLLLQTRGSWWSSFELQDERGRWYRRHAIKDGGDRRKSSPSWRLATLMNSMWPTPFLSDIRAHQSEFGESRIHQINSGPDPKKDT